MSPKAKRKLVSVHKREPNNGCGCWLCSPKERAYRYKLAKANLVDETEYDPQLLCGWSVMFDDGLAHVSKWEDVNWIVLGFDEHYYDDHCECDGCMHPYIRTGSGLWSNPGATVDGRERSTNYLGMWLKPVTNGLHL